MSNLSGAKAWYLCKVRIFLYICKLYRKSANNN